MCVYIYICVCAQENEEIIIENDVINTITDEKRRRERERDC